MLAESAISEMKSFLGEHQIVSDETERRFYSTDVYRTCGLAGVVVRPSNAEQVQKILNLAQRFSLAVYVRGGGASYSDAFLPTHDSSILIDSSSLARIVEINEVDMFATVEPGVTWQQLDDALKLRGLRTPFWGPFSGLAATIGGSVSQHTLSHGSAAHGISAESVVSMDVVLANGDLVRTGSASHRNQESPFYRFSGPDLTALFTGDCGALGIKTSITLRLIRRRSSISCESFSFPSFGNLSAALAEAAREQLADENFALDPVLQEGQIARQDARTMMRAAWQVFTSSTNPLTGAVTLSRMALSGRGFLEKGAYSAHFILNGINQGEVRARSSALRHICMRHGVMISNTVPTVVNSMPFAPLYNILGPRGERWVPVHAILPFSEAGAFHENWKALAAAEAQAMDRYNVNVGAMFSTISTNAFLYELAFYWEDERSIFHNRILPQAYLETLKSYEPSQEARDYVDALKQKAIALMAEFGAVHFQLGKAYPFLANQEPNTARLLERLKKQLDPNNILNPGALGFSAQ